MVKIISWNVNGLRSIIKKGIFYEFVNEYNPDIICLQEVRATPDQLKLNEQFTSEYSFQIFNKMLATFAFLHLAGAAADDSSLFSGPGEYWIAREKYFSDPTCAQERKFETPLNV